MEVAIIGIGCRVPGACGPRGFWRQLTRDRGPTDQSQDWPGDTETADAAAAFGLDAFDNRWFGISNSVAAQLHPLQRSSLETAVEAIDDAGIGYRVRGSDTAVVFGTTSATNTTAGPGLPPQPYPSAESAPGTVVDHLATTLDLRGPLIMLDSVRSSSLAAVDLGVRLLADPTVPLVVVGAVDRCAAVLVLQRTTDARREGNRIYAHIAGVASGCDPADTATPAKADAASARRIARTAWRRAGHDPAAAAYSYRAVGMIGLVEAALSIHHGVIPASPGWRRTGGASREKRGAARSSAWRDTPPTDRYLGVTCLGSEGTRTHIVLRPAAAPKPDRDTDPPVLIALSERDPESLRQLADDWATDLADAPRPLRELAAAAGRVMTEPARAVVLAWNRLDAAAGVQALATPPEHDIPTTAITVTPVGRTGAVIAQAPRPPSGQHTVRPERNSGGLLWLFSCPGGHHARMGRALAARYPVFAQALLEITDAVVQAGGPQVWTPRHGFGPGLDDVVGVQLATFTYQVALAWLLQSWGIRPDAVAGHGAGEVAAAVVCRALSLTDGARLALARGQLLTQAARVSAALVAASPEEARELLESCCTAARSDSKTAGLAAVHGPRSVVVAGPRRHIDAVVRRARRQRLVATHAAADLAGLGPVSTELPPEFLAVVQELAGKVPPLPWYSPVRQGQCVTTALDEQYWIDNARGVVDLAAVLDCAAAAGTTTVLELAPHAILTPAIADHPDFRGTAVATTGWAGRQATTGQDSAADEATGYLRAIACLFVRGRFVDWSAAGSFTGPVLDRHWRAGEPTMGSPAVAVPADPEASVPASYWLHHLLQTAGDGCTRLTDVLLSFGFPAAALPDITSHVGLEAVAAVLGNPGDNGTDRHRPTLIASARPAPPPAPAEIVSWLRIVDAHRGAYRSMRTLSAEACSAELCRHGLADAEAPRALRLLSIGDHSAIGLFGHETLDSTSLEGCLQLAVMAATAAERQRHPVPDGIASVWVCDAAATLLAEAHAFIRAVERTGLTADVIGLDQCGAPVVALVGIRLRFTDDPAPAPADDTADYEPPAPRAEVWCPAPPLPKGRCGTHAPTRALVVGRSALAQRLVANQRVPTQRVDEDPGSTSAILARVAAHPTERTAVILVWPAETDTAATAPTDLGDSEALTDTAVAAVEAHLTVLRELAGCEAVSSLTVVLRDPSALPQAAVAGLVRALRRRCAAALQLVWLDSWSSPAASLPDLLLAAHAYPEVRISETGILMRRFAPVTSTEPQDSTQNPYTPIRPNGTYVVTGGLGAAGAASARWLLDCGAREVVVLTRAPRPLPPLLAAVEDRIVIVRCDVRDRADLANALHDVRECGSTIHGVVHAAGLTATTPHEMGPILAASFALLDLTASDPVDFVLLYRSAAGAFGAGEPLHAAADAAVEAVARTVTGRRVVSVGWGGWADTTVPAVGHRELRQAGVVPFDAVRAAAILPAILGQPDPSVVAVDFRPGGRSPLAGELAAVLDDTALADSDQAP